VHDLMRMEALRVSTPSAFSTGFRAKFMDPEDRPRWPGGK
jgi:hypothetical protein